MRGSLLARCSIAAAATLSATPALAQEPAPVCLAVPPFANTSEWSDDAIGEAAAAELADLLFDSGRFEIIGPAQLAPHLDAADVDAVDPFDRELQARIGAAVGCPNLLTGRVAQFSVASYSAGLRLVRGSVTRATATVVAYLIDTARDEVVVDIEGEGSKTAAGGSVDDVKAEIESDVGAARETLRPALEEIARRVTRSAGELSPRPAADSVAVAGGNVVGGGDDGSVYIDLGADQAVEPGQRFEVLRVIDEIRGTNDELLDTIVDVVGVLEVTRVLSRSSICTLIEGEATRGDTIRPVERLPDGP